jgi:hypothetical protein
MCHPASDSPQPADRRAQRRESDRPAPAPAPGQPGYGSVLDRRSGVDRREMNAALSGEPYSGLERRRGAGRRLSDALRNAEEGTFSREQFLFVKAIDTFKQANQVQFPAWTDVLEVIRLLGYRKTMPSELALPSCEDWNEPADAPANVRPDGFHRRLDGTVGQRERRKFAA